MREMNLRRTLQHRKVHMKKSILITTLAILGLAGFGAAAEAADRREYSRNRSSYPDHSDYRQLRAELNQLNIMFARVNNHLRTFGGGGRSLRWEYSRLIRDRDRLNIELQRRNPDRFRIRMQIDRLRDQLREIEVRLRVRGIRHPRSYR